MRRVVNIIVFCFAVAGIAMGNISCQSKKSNNQNGEDMKVLVSYFSATGTTKAVAETLKKVLGADIYEIRPEVAYTSVDLDWHNSESRSSVEMHSREFRPAMADKNAKIEDYDIVYIGFPIWWYVAPTIINTFLESYDFSGKTVILFATSGGSDFGETVENLKGSCASTTIIKEGKVFRGRSNETEIATWIESMKE